MGSVVGFREGRMLVAGLCAALSMLILDVAVIYVALLTISRDLPIADSTMHLVGVAYTVAFASLVILFGRVGDLLGRRRVLLGQLGSHALDQSPQQDRQPAQHGATMAP